MSVGIIDFWYIELIYCLIIFYVIVGMLWYYILNLFAYYTLNTLLSLFYYCDYYFIFTIFTIFTTYIIVVIFIINIITITMHIFIADLCYRQR